MRLPLLAASRPVPGPVVTVAAAFPDSDRTIGEPQAGGLRILMVEDHGDTADMLRCMLESEGHNVQAAGAVATAVDLAGRHSFDLLISDLGLPDGSGVDLMRARRAAGNSLPGIALSGYGQDQDLQQSRDAGFAAHIVKPVDMDHLFAAIASIADRQHG